MDPMLATIFVIPWSWAPYAFLSCNGQVLDIRQYNAVYALLGTTYGGTPNTNFNLPNLQGRAPIGVGTGPTGTPYTLAQKVGQEGATLGPAALLAHTHAATFTPTTVAQNISIPAVTGPMPTVNATLTAVQVAGQANPQTDYVLGRGGASGASASIYVSPSAAAGQPTASLGGLGVNIAGSAATPAASGSVTTLTGGAVTVAPTGGQSAVSVMQPYLALNFIIAMQGVFPSRDN